MYVVGTEGEIDLDGSPTQKTTLTGDVTATFVGTVPADTARCVRYHVTHASNNLDIPVANGGGSDWTSRRDALMGAKASYVVAFATDPAGVAQYEGAY